MRDALSAFTRFHSRLNLSADRLSGINLKMLLCASAGLALIVFAAAAGLAVAIAAAVTGVHALQAGVDATQAATLVAAACSATAAAVTGLRLWRRVFPPEV